MMLFNVILSVCHLFLLLSFVRQDYRSQHDRERRSNTVCLSLLIQSETFHLYKTITRDMAKYLFSQSLVSHMCSELKLYIFSEVLAELTVQTPLPTPFQISL